MNWIRVQMMPAALGRLRVAALKKVAMECGVSPRGNKIEIADRVCSFAASRPPAGSDLRIVSIDMGIRNIGICAMKSLWNKKPQLDKWYLASLDTDFSQPSFASAANKFVTNHILTYDPQVVLVEKQRSRSGGSPQIPNAILRTNVFEGMVHAILTTLKTRPYVESIDPRLVIARYDNREPSKRKTYSASKRVRTELVKQWLMSPEAAPCTFTSDLDERNFTGKKDDLADSLVQAVAWNRWRYELAKLASL